MHYSGAQIPSREVLTFSVGQPLLGSAFGAVETWGWNRKRKRIVGKLRGVAPEPRLSKFRAREYRGRLVETQIAGPHPNRF